ncbi:MAG: hypothetical protein IT159_12920 [Bryobacterales bacterium]|nr:hypothetical protein [Bryobacterales bacterium]
MLRFITLCLLLVLILMPAQGALLVWSTGNFAGRTSDVAAWLDASGMFDSVTGVDTDILSLNDLLAYDQVLYFSNGSYGQDPVAIGDVLDSYAATGRRLVLATFSWSGQGGNTLAGNIIANGTSPFVTNGASLYSPATMGWIDGSGFFKGVGSVGGLFRDNVVLTPGATLRATWSDGTPLLATNGNVVAVNLFPDGYWGNLSGDYATLFANTLGIKDEDIMPEPATFLLAGAALMSLFLVRLRRR